MLLLTAAKLTVCFVPFRRWRRRLGGTAGEISVPALEEGNRVAAIVECAAQRLPFETKCLPRAMAVSWLLRGRRLPHEVVFAVRPYQERSTPDALHAWVEIDGHKIIGDLPGPWIETLRVSD